MHLFREESWAIKIAEPLCFPHSLSPKFNGWSQVPHRTRELQTAVGWSWFSFCWSKFNLAKKPLFYYFHCQVTHSNSITITITITITNHETLYSLAFPSSKRSKLKRVLVLLLIQSLWTEKSWVFFLILEPPNWFLEIPCRLFCVCVNRRLARVRKCWALRSFGRRKHWWLLGWDSFSLSSLLLLDFHPLNLLEEVQLQFSSFSSI